MASGKPLPDPENIMLEGMARATSNLRGQAGPTHHQRQFLTELDVAPNLIGPLHDIQPCSPSLCAPHPALLPPPSRSLSLTICSRLLPGPGPEGSLLRILARGPTGQNRTRMLAVLQQEHSLSPPYPSLLAPSFPHVPGTNRNYHRFHRQSWTQVPSG